MNESQQAKAKLNREEVPLRSDQLPDSDPAAWFEGQPLREAVLLMYPESLRDHLREAGSYLTLAFLDLGSFDPAYRGSITGGLLHAIELDLRFSARMLAWSAREAIRYSATSNVETDLGWFADECAMRVEAVADQIAARLGDSSKENESNV